MASSSAKFCPKTRTVPSLSRLFFGFDMNLSMHFPVGGTKEIADPLVLCDVIRAVAGVHGQLRVGPKEIADPSVFRHDLWCCVTSSVQWQSSWSLAFSVSA
jgi:hypothetical protein